jgi:polysaccharide biosynthesis PFTS motif protein
MLKRNRFSLEQETSRLIDRLGRHFLLNLKSDISEVRIELRRYSKLWIYKGYEKETLEVLLSQIYYAEVIDRHLVKRILRAQSRGSRISGIPLESQIIALLENNSLKVSRFRCRAWLFFFGIKRLSQAGYELFNIVLSRPPFADTRHATEAPRCHLVDGIPGMVGIPSNDFERCDFANWYRNWLHPSSEPSTLTHCIPDVPRYNLNNLTVERVSSLFHRLNSTSKINVLFFSIRAALISIFYLLQLKSQSSILLPEIIRARAFRHLQSEDAAQAYWFSVSCMLIRPLWTYEAEAKGSKIVLYNYAGSFGGIKDPSAGHLKSEPGLKSSTWPFFLNWAPHYCQYLKNNISRRTKVLLTKPIFLTDTNIPFSGCERSIALFDVAPGYPRNRLAYGSCDNFRTVEIGIQFLEDILKIAEQLDLTIFWKPKRLFSEQHHIQYIHYVDDFSKNPHITRLEPQTAAHRIILNTDCTISLPFTSTSIFAKYCGKPACFYDPVNMILPDDQGIQDITLISGAQRLARWISTSLEIQ